MNVRNNLELYKSRDMPFQRVCAYNSLTPYATFALSLPVGATFDDKAIHQTVLCLDQK